ncbi:hypothetical protein [Leuconostoc pseudomesenteroides]|uniref:hypothetical protein n=1 Tax=Leuconostoc pseudomesenteroides TaxID=33968 RepID=UPI0039E9DB01
MYTVLNNDFQVKGSLTLNNGRGSTAFFADTITQQIATDDSNNPDTLLSNSFNDYDKQGNTKQWNHTLTLSIEATTLGTSITTSDYIMYFDEVAKKYYMMKVIDTATDRNSGFITVDCINTAIYELGKQLVVEEKTFQNANLSQVVESVYKDAPFSVVIQDDLTISINYTISANTSLQAVVQDLQTKYNVDVDSWITLDNNGQIGERVLYFGHLGSDNGELIRYGGGKGFENINAQELSDIIYTKVYITGVTSDTDTTKGHIGSVNNGLEYIVDDDANQRMYTVGASQQQPVYLEGQLTNNILSEPMALLDWGKEQLALFNHPRFNYTVTPLHDEVVGIGDSITVQDFHIQPMILVTSKVIQKSTSFASPETNTFVLGEFSSIFSDRTSKNNMVIEVIKKDVTVVQEAADYAKAQADEAHRQAVLAQEQAIHAQISADGKTTTYTVDDFQDLPGNAVEGDLGWVKTSDGTVMYIYTKKADGTFAWVENVNPHTKEDIANAVDASVKTAKQYTDDAIKTNNTDINNTINEVSQEKIDATLADADFNKKAQDMADKALQDAKADTDGKISQQQVTINGITDTVSEQGKNIDSVTQRVTNAEGTLTTATNNISGLQTKQTTTANQVTQEISDRKTGDSNSLQSSKDFTTSSITNYDKGIQSQMTQTASGILAQVGSTNLFPNSEFESDYGYESLSGNVKLSLAYKWAVGSNQNGVVEIKTTANSYQGYVAEKISVFGGSTISFSTLLHYENGGFATGQAGVDMRFRDRDGNETGKQIRYLPQQNDYWTTVLMENIYVPDNSVSLSITLIVNDAGAGQYAVFTQPMLVNSSTIKKYTPNTGITDSLSLLKDNWSIGIADNVGAITSGIVGDTNSISLINKHIILDSENTTVTGDFYALGGNFKNLNASNVTFGTLNGNQVNITNVNVSNLVGDTITGFNFNINKSMTIAPGGTITSGIMSMTNDGFSIVSQAGGFTVTANNIAASRQSPQGYKVTGYGTYHINSELGLSGGDGTIQVFNPGDTSGTPYKTGAFHSEYGLNNLLIKTSNYSNGDSDEYLNISSAAFDLYNMDKSNNITHSVNISKGSGTFSDSMTVPTINATTVYNDTNLWLKSNKNSVVLQGGGTNILQARENGYLYYMTMKTGSGGLSVQASGKDGAFFIQTSATKYKTDIQYEKDTSIGDRLLTLDPATWQDKGDKEQRDLFHKTGEEPNHIINMDDKRYYGLIAEDLVKAGLEEFVVRDEVTGEVNGLEYDKVAISLIPVVRKQRNALNELRVEIERLKEKIK